MELLSVQTGRAVWIFDVAELNPRGKSIFPDLLEWLGEEYHFEKYPKTAAEVDQETKAFVFTRGDFQAEEETFFDINLKIFNDGLVADTWSSTRNAEAFLESVMMSAALEFNLKYQPQIVRRKMYVSEIVVRSSKSTLGVNDKLSQIAAKVYEALPPTSKLPYEFSGLIVGPIQATSNLNLSPFRIERKLNSLPEERKFYATAPLHTDDHLKLLDWFEQEFME